MTNRPGDSNRLVAAGRKKFNLNFRSHRQIRHRKQAHSHIAQIDAKRTHAGRAGEYLDRSIQQLPPSASPLVGVVFENHLRETTEYKVARSLSGTKITEVQWVHHDFDCRKPASAAIAVRSTCYGHYDSTWSKLRSAFRAPAPTEGLMKKARLTLMFVPCLVGMLLVPALSAQNEPVRVIAFGAHPGRLRSRRRRSGRQICRARPQG